MTITFPQAFTFVTAVCLALLTLWEIFETIVLPRKIDRKFRITRYYYLATWRAYLFLSDRVVRPMPVRFSQRSVIASPLTLLTSFRKDY